MLKVVCIGAGRLAQQLMPALEEAGCHIVQVYNRTPQDAQDLADKLKGSSDTSDMPSRYFLLSYTPCFRRMPLVFTAQVAWD